MLYTVNTNDFMTDVARKSFVSASRRWGCEYKEYTLDPSPGCPSRSKLLAAQEFSYFEKQVFMDADIVISEFAPSPFQLCVSPNTLYAVSDFQTANQTYDWKTYAFHKPIDKYMESHPFCRIMPYEKFFNAGMFMFISGNTILSMLLSAFESVPEDSHKITEQAIFNMVAYNYPGISIHLLPVTWNYMVRTKTGPRRKFYINHYGGDAQDLLKNAK